jgi:hypothetical protein
MKTQWPFGWEGSDVGTSGRTQGNCKSGGTCIVGDWTSRVGSHHSGLGIYL